MRRLFDRRHWPEYLIEAGALGLFMVSASVFTILLEHPASPVRMAIAAPVLRRMLMGLAMGSTAIAIIYSPFGARSGAHMNPAVTLTFLRLGKVRLEDAVPYVFMQFVGGLTGLGLAALAARALLADPAVDFVATRPGMFGQAVAFAAEVVIAFALMLVVLAVSNGPHARFTGLSAGLMVALYISLEAPISGMSLNPARSFAPALLSGNFAGLWIYFTAPLAGMALAGETFARRYGLRAVICAKLNHAGSGPCIFGCGANAASV